jgi:hypothetical protein
MKLQYGTAIHLETTVCVKATYVETAVCATDTHVETVISLTAIVCRPHIQTAVCES